MRPLTAVAIILVVGFLGGVVFVAFGGPSAESGTLTEKWVSDTPRETQTNHHAIGIGPNKRSVVAPVAETPAKAVSNTSCSLNRLTPETGAVQWRAGIPPEDCATHGLTQPEIADIDTDEDLEVISGTTADNGTLIAYDGQSGDELFRVSLPSYAGYGQPTVANITTDPSSEIVAVDLESNIVVVDGNGSVLWRRDLNGTTYTSPIVTDIDGDGETEITVGTRSGTVVLTPSGEIENQSNVGVTYLTHGDVDDDSTIELFLSNSDTVAALDGNTMKVQWKASFEETPQIHTVSNGDGEPKVYVGLSDQRVIALSATTGDRQWGTQVGTEGGTMMPAPIAGDLSGDGDSEVVAVTTSGTVTVLNAETGSELAAYDRNVPVLVHPSIADLDSDDNLEILVRYGDGRVVALDYSQ